MPKPKPQTTPDTPDRDPKGRFAPGNAGGPGRPRRSVEVEYLSALADLVPLAIWKLIVRRAVAEALTGDARAREWLAGFLLGHAPYSLTELAAREAAVNIDDQINTRAEEIRHDLERQRFTAEI